MARTEIGEIYYRITGDNSGLKRTLNESDSGVSKLSGNLTKLGGVVAGAFAVQKIGSFVKSLIGAASDANETQSKFNTVFENIKGSANSAADEIAKSYGLSQKAAQDYLSSAGDILTGLELTQQASFDTSAEIVKLSADLTSFKNFSGGVEGAQHAITSALLGEREALKGLGIAITDADLKSFAAESGLVWQNLDKQRQATLTLELITKRAGNAVGDFARTSDQLANQIRIAQSAQEDFAAEMGKPFLSIASKAVEIYTGLIKGTTDAVKGWREAVGELNFAEFERAKRNSILAKEEMKLTNLLKQQAISYSEERARAVESSEKKIKEIRKANAEEDAANQKAEVERTKAKADEKSAFELAYTEKLKSYTQSEFDKKVEIAALETKLKQAERSGDIGLYLEYQNRLNSIHDQAATLREQRNQQEHQATMDQLNAVSSFASQVFSGVDKLMSTLSGNIQRQSAETIDRIQAQGESYLEALDMQMQAALEAAGVAEETQLERLQRELQAAIDSGDTQTQAQLEDEITRYNITTDYAKKKEDRQKKTEKEIAKAQYDAALQVWNMQVAKAWSDAALADLQAVIAGLQFGLGAEVAIPIFVGIATAASGANIAAVYDAKPKPPAFETGGIVPGSSFSGDNLTARVNSGEMILNKQQQANLFSMINGGGGGGNVNVQVQIGEYPFTEFIYKLSKNGKVKIHNGAITNL